MRLDKALTLAGYTRTEAKAMIARGRVRVAGAAVRDAGMAVRPEDVLLDGAPLQAEREVYLMLNKPAGVVTATADARLPTVVSLLLSLESVFAAVGGAVLLHERLTGRELLGCGLMMVAIVLAELPDRKSQNT